MTKLATSTTSTSASAIAAITTTTLLSRTARITVHPTARANFYKSVIQLVAVSVILYFTIYAFSWAIGIDVWRSDFSTTIRVITILLVILDLLAFDNICFMEEDLMSSQTHVPERMGWLRDAAQEFLDKTTKHAIDCETRGSALAKLHERYLGVEDLVERFFVWKEEKLAKTKPLDLNAKELTEASESLCTMLWHSLQLRQEALAVKTNQVIERRLRVDCNKAEKLQTLKALCPEFDDLRHDYNKFFKNGRDAHAGRCSEWYHDRKICSWQSLASCCEYVGGKQTREQVLTKLYEESMGRFFDAELISVEMEEIKQRKQRK